MRDPMLMMLPRPCSTMVGTTARQHKYVPLRMVATLWSHSSGTMSSRVLPKTITPALFTSTSTWPYMSMVWPTMAMTCSSFATSQVNAMASPPADLICSAVSTAVPGKPVGELRRAEMTTLAPSAAYSFAMALPRPRLAPVTIATMPSILFVCNGCICKPCAAVLRSELGFNPAFIERSPEMGSEG